MVTKKSDWVKPEAQQAAVPGVSAKERIIEAESQRAARPATGYGPSLLRNVPKDCLGRRKWRDGALLRSRTTARYTSAVQDE
jgi:hypothetical protein